jgi:hypothetical protein
MPSITEIAVTWSSGSASTTVSSATPVTSDVIGLTAGDRSYILMVSADNAGTPASGDICRVYLARTTGDILGDSGDDYDTTEHAEYVGQLDTVAANTPGEDPARKSWAVDLAGAKGARVIVECPQAATRNIVCRARLSALRP